MTDWEVYWELISRVSQVGVILIRAYFLCRLVKPFLIYEKLQQQKIFHDSAGKSRIFAICERLYTLLYTALSGICYAVVMLAAAFCNNEVSVIFVYTVSVLAAFLVLYLTDRRNAAQKVFLAVIFYLLQWITGGIILVPWTGAYHFLLFASGNPKSHLIQFALYAVMEILYLAMSYLCMAFCVRMIHKEYSHKAENMTGRELALMLAPLCSVAAGQGIFHFAVSAYEKDIGRYIWEAHPIYVAVQAGFMFLSFAAVLTVILSYQRIKDSKRREKEDAVLSGQIEEMKRHIGEVEKLYFDIRSLKHDMGNHIMTLEKLCGENEAAGEYIAQLKKQVSAAAPEIASGNPVTDVILWEKQKEAEEKNIAFTHQFYFPEDTGLSAFDVSVILHNALSNAIEAAEECEKPYIRVFSYRKKNAFLIEVRNSAAGRRSIDAESGLPLTTKAGAGHGFGLANIRKVAQKYYGDVVIEQGDGEFGVVVMVMV